MSKDDNQHQQSRREGENRYLVCIPSKSIFSYSTVLISLLIVIITIIITKVPRCCWTGEAVTSEATYDIAKQEQLWQLSLEYSGVLEKDKECLPFIESNNKSENEDGKTPIQFVPSALQLAISSMANACCCWCCA